MQNTASRSKITSLFQILSSVFLLTSLIGCDGRDPVNMRKPGDNKGNENAGCTDRCKAAQEANADKYSKIALQAGSWAEMILLAAHGESGNNSFWRCAIPQVSDTQVVFNSEMGDNVDCNFGTQTVKVNLVADIKRDSNKNIIKITVPETLKAFTVTTKNKDNYSITTSIGVESISITKEADKMYDVESKLNFHSERVPEGEYETTHGISEMGSSVFSLSALVLVSPDFKSTELRLKNKLQFDTETQSGRSPSDMAPASYRSELAISTKGDVDTDIATLCGVPAGELSYKNDISTQIPGKDWSDRDGFDGNMKVSATSMKDTFTGLTQKIVTCDGPIVQRLNSLADHMEMLFSELYGRIGTPKAVPVPAQQVEKPADKSKDGNGTDNLKRKTGDKPQPLKKGQVDCSAKERGSVPKNRCP